MSERKPFDPIAEAEKIAFDRLGSGERVLLISGFPQTRLSWGKLVPLLAARFETITADLPSFGNSGFLTVPATTELVGRIFHAFTAMIGSPLHVVAHDFGAWVAFSWALLFPGDFRSVTLIDAGIPGVTLTNDIQLSDYKRKWNFIFQMLPDLPAELVRGKEDVYVGWWFKNKVFKTGAIPPQDVAAYIRGSDKLAKGGWTPRSTTAAILSWTWSSTPIIFQRQAADPALGGRSRSLDPRDGRVPKALFPKCHRAGDRRLWPFRTRGAARGACEGAPLLPVAPGPLSACRMAAVTDEERSG